MGDPFFKSLNKLLVPLLTKIVSLYRLESIRNNQKVIENSSASFISLNSKGVSEMYADAPCLKEGPGVKVCLLGKRLSKFMWYTVLFKNF